MPFKEIAAAALERGFSIIPLVPKAKDPLPGWGPTKKSRNVGSFEQVPMDCNVGIVADENFLILETDDESQLRQLIRNYTGRELPITLTSQARFGRPHFFYRQTPRSLEVGNCTVPGLFELRSKNQYVVGPGSVHPTGAVYSITADYEVLPMPGWLVDCLLYLKGAAATVPAGQRVEVPLSGKVGEGEGRHYLLTSWAGRLWDGKKTEEELFSEVWAINEQSCDPPRTEPHVRDIVRWVMQNGTPHDPGPKVVFGGRDVTQSGKKVEIGSDLYPESPRVSPSVFIVPPTQEGNDGWFVRGEVNLVVGSSGAGKSTIMYQMLEKIRQGNGFMQHSPAPIEYGILSHDRSIEAFQRTARRLKLSEEAQKRVHFVDDMERGTHPAVVVCEFLKKHENEIIDLLFIEGLDMWVPNADVNNFYVVQNFLTAMQKVAKIWNVAIVGSVGSPKQKPKDKYLLQRDNVLGSIAWGRKTETIVFLELSSPENPNSARRMTVLLRNGPAEIFELTWKDGRLEVAEPEETEPLQGVKERSKTDALSLLIGYLEEIPEGTIINFDDLQFLEVHKKTVTRYLAKLSDPRGGKVHFNKGKWIRGSRPAQNLQIGEN